MEEFSYPLFGPVIINPNASFLVMKRDLNHHPLLLRELESPKKMELKKHAMEVEY